MDTEKLLEDRGKTHGDFFNNARCSQALKNVIAGYGAELSDVQQEALDMICLKISRIVTGNPKVRDHWDDLAGYAQLGSRSIQ